MTLTSITIKKYYLFRQLDLTEYVINNKQSRAVYDLHAVSVGKR